MRIPYPRGEVVLSFQSLPLHEYPYPQNKWWYGHRKESLGSMPQDGVGACGTNHKFIILGKYISISMIRWGFPKEEG